MLKVGDTLYGMRIVKTYHGQSYEEEPLFSGFEGIVVWNTWDTGDWEILFTWKENRKYRTKEIGYVEDKKIKPHYSGEQVAEFIKEEVNKILKKKENNRLLERKAMELQVTEQQIREELMASEIIAPINVKALYHVSKKVFNKLVEWITVYVNKQINIAIQPLLKRSNNLIAIDETIASIIQIHDERESIT